MLQKVSSNHSCWELEFYDLQGNKISGILGTSIVLLGDFPFGVFFPLLVLSNEFLLGVLLVEVLLEAMAAYPLLYDTDNLAFEVFIDALALKELFSIFLI